MHPATTRSEFLRLRVEGLSLASIGRRLGVSKPTLIAWNRQSQSEIHSRIIEDQQRVKQEITASTDQQLADLTRKLTAVKQELFSRALRDIPTAHVETLAGELRQRIESLESTKNGSPVHTAPKSDESGLAAPKSDEGGSPASTLKTQNFFRTHPNLIEPQKKYLFDPYARSNR